MDDGPRLPRLMFVTDRRRFAHPLPEIVAAAVAGGADGVQLRERDLGQSELLALASDLRDVIGNRAQLIVNGRPAVAAALGLGLHLPEAGFVTAEARRQIGSGALLGRSVHSPEAAAAVGADYLIAGHVFPTPSKPDEPPLGLVGLQQIVAATWAPVFAIGGITATNAAAAIKSGAQGIAVVGAIGQAPDPARAAADLRTAIDDLLGPPQPPPLDEDAPMQITINGKETQVEPDTTVADYLADRGFQDRLVAVELNGAILSRRQFDSTHLADGDTLEIVHFVGGG